MLATGTDNLGGSVQNVQIYCGEALVASITGVDSTPGWLGYQLYGQYFREHGDYERFSKALHDVLTTYGRVEGVVIVDPVPPSRLAAWRMKVISGIDVDAKCDF